MKRKSLLIMLLVALFVPLAMNAQEKMSKKRAVQSSQLERKFAEAMIPSRTVNVQNGMNKNNSVQISNLESRNFNTLTSSNAMSRGTRDVQYELVSSELTDWSGNYIVGLDGSTLVYAFDGDVYDTQSDYGSNIGGFASVGQSSGTIADAGDAAILTFTAVDGADGWYTITVNGQYYLGSNPTEGLVMSSSLSSYDYFWTVYWYSNSNVPILFSYSDYDDDNAYGLTFFIGTDSDGSWGGFCTYELSDSSTEFEYYYAKLYKETTSGGSTTDCNSVTFSSLYNTNTNLNGVSVPIDNVSSVSFARNNGNNDPQYYTNGSSVRVYPKNSFTVTSTSNIVSINLTFGSSDSNNTITANTGTYNNGAWTGSATSVTFTVGGTKNNRRIAAIEVCVEGSNCDAPTNLTTTDITNSTATLGWTGDLDEYNVRYRKGFVYDFESAEPWTYTDFTPCTTYDGDGGSTYGLNNYTFPNQYYVGACIAFQNGINTNMVSHDGNAFGVMFNQDDGASNDWFILPEITVQNGDVFSFWTREVTTNYGDEIINVGICGSTDGTFSSYLAQNVGISSTTWEEKSYDLSNYAGQTIKLAINCVSNDVFGLMIDDIFVGNPSESWSTPVAVTGTTYPLEGLDSNSDYTWQVQGNCDNTTTNWISAYFTTLNNIPVESITASDVTVDVNGTATISYTLDPTEPTDPTVSFSSANTGIATVDANGVVTGVTAGNTTITITANDGFGATTTINVTVNPIVVTGITATPTEITMITGETAQISYTVAPENATDASVTFTSEDATIATVDASGVVTGVSVGETTITIVSVSNPEVTATITVTVTSNPNAAQFTVNAPANAAPGDVITVECVLNAPTEGTYNGFTGMVLGLHFNTEAFAVYGNPVPGPVASASTTTMPSLPNENHETVNYSCVMTPGNPNTTTGLVFSMQFTVLTEAELGSYTFYVEPTAANQFVYNPGSSATPIPYEYVPSTVVVAVPEHYTILIDAYTENGNGWYLISSPIGQVAATAVTNMTSNNQEGYIFDLYQFDQSQNQQEWQNYKNGWFTNLEPGKGYLYANNTGDDLLFYGQAYTGEATFDLSYDENANLPGRNLVGNPFANIAYIADGRPFYTMNAGGTEIISATSNSIELGEGLFVNAENAEDNQITFTTTEPESNGAKLALNLSNGRAVIDRAIVSFGEGRQLPKFQINRNHTKVYIPQEGEDYAVVRAEEMGEMPVNFMAENNGTYSLSFSSENTEFAYLHLIDNLTGTDVDLLKTQSYSFEARTTDYESRFKLVFATGNNGDNDTFAFFSNGSFVINNEGNATLQVIDVMGRILSSETISGCTSVNVNAAPGVYTLRLLNGDNVKTQKVVVK